MDKATKKQISLATTISSNFIRGFLFVFITAVSIAELPIEKKYKHVEPWAFERLRPCAITAQGRWRQIMETIANGWIRRIAEAEDPTFHTILYAKQWESLKNDAAALGVYNAGGIVRLGCLLPDSYIGREYRQRWLPAVLRSQMKNGYIGAGFSENTFDIDLSSGQKFITPIPKYELLNADLTLEMLLYEYEYSGDVKVFDAARRFGEFLLNEFLKPEQYNPRLRTPHHIAIFRSGLAELYEFTGNERIIDHLRRYYATMAGSFKTWLSNKRPHHHLPDLCYTLQAPITMYHLTGNPELRELFLMGYENITNFALQTSGALTGVEITLEKGPRKWTEHCGVVEWINACMRLLRSAGQVRFADAAEKCFFNAYLGSKKPDGLSLQYYHTMNQLFATTWTGQYLRDYEPSDVFNGRFSMRHSPGCCNAITSKAFADFLRNAALRTADGGYAFVFYGPYDVNDTHPTIGQIAIRQTTDYPFADQVALKIDRISSQQPLAFYFRVPHWCSAAQFYVNGQALAVQATPGTFAKIQRVWKSGDIILLRFDIPIQLDIQREPGTGVGAAIVRGPLVFALPVSADWQYIGKTPPGNSNTQEDWNAVPKGTTVWNIALELDSNNPARLLERTPLNSQQAQQYDGWGGAPFGYKAWARVLPDWRYDRQNGNPVTPGIPTRIIPSEQRIEVILIPFGFTQLRMTVLPFLDSPSPCAVEHGKSDADI